MVQSRVILRSLALFAFAVLILGGLAQSGGEVSAAPQTAPIAQCNNDTASNVGGQGLSCTITIVNFVTSSGSATTTPSTITLTRCFGAAGPIGAGAGTCSTTTSTSPTPITQVQQCDGVSNGGGGVLICTVTMTNNFSGTPAQAVGPASVYQCVGSAITGPGAPGTCTPVNTPGVSSVTAATVGQCNGSGNGGTSVGFICTVSTGSTETSILPVNIDQCNGSANGGGALVRCQASVTSVVSAAAVTPTPTPVTVVTPTATPAPAVVVTPTATPTPITRLPSTSTDGPSAAPAVLIGSLVGLAGALILQARRSWAAR
ncbi:MAG TPA: hypothetical protein VM070_04270 [Candidatus Saccharimonadales bacterium]|nr:hypothetical protein [Candidatus Saccharimonadales bacterium]